MNSRPLRKISLIDAYGFGACTLLTLLFILFVLMPAVNGRREVEVRRSELAEAKVKASLLALQISQATKDLENLRQTLAANPLKLEDVDHLNNRLSDLSTFCASCGVDIHDLSPGAATLDSGYSTVHISLIGRGSYRTCMLFLHRLHERFLDVSVNDFRLSSDADDSSSLSAQFELRWYAKPGSIASSQ